MSLRFVCVCVRVVSEFLANCRSITLWFDLLPFEFDKLTLFVAFDDVLRHQRLTIVEGLAK